MPMGKELLKTKHNIFLTSLLGADKENLLKGFIAEQKQAGKKIVLAGINGLVASKFPEGCTLHRFLKRNTVQNDFTEAMLTEFLVDQVENNHTEFDELEGYRGHGFTEDLGMYECRIETSCYSVEVLDFAVDETKKHISGKAIASYTVSARTTDFYGVEPMSHFQLGEEEAASTFYFEIDLDEDDFAKSYCEIEVGSPCAL